MGMSEAFEEMAAENLALRARAEKAEAERDAAVILRWIKEQEVLA